MGGVVVLAMAAIAPPIALRGVEAEPPPQRLRYDFEAGDRLVYRETLTRERTGRDSLSVVEAEWTSEVLVLGVGREGAVVGIQRLARNPAIVAEANVFTRLGQALLAPQVKREWSSDLLPFVHEIEALPAEPLAPGTLLARDPSAGTRVPGGGLGGRGGRHVPPGPREPPRRPGGPPPLVQPEGRRPAPGRARGRVCHRGRGVPGEAASRAPRAPPGRVARGLARRPRPPARRARRAADRGRAIRGAGEDRGPPCR